MIKKARSSTGPKPLCHLFGFMDETGLLTTPKTDRIFGLGLLIVSKTKYMHDQLVKYRQRKSFNDEFKFSRVRRNNLPLYKGLVDIFFDTVSARFCVLIVDKKNITIKKHTKAYNSFAGALIAKSIDSSDGSHSEYITILADDVSTAIDDGYEKEIKAKVKRVLRRNALYGVCRLESHALTEIQLCDVLLGAVAYSFKIREGILKSPNAAKVDLVKYIQTKLGVAQLSITFDNYGPKGVRFHVIEKA